MKQVSEAKVPDSRASELIPLMKGMGIVDLSARITSADGFKLVPILAGCESEAAGLGLELTSGPAYSEASRPPLERILAHLKGVPVSMHSLLPDKWENAGDVVTVHAQADEGGEFGEPHRYFASVAVAAGFPSAGAAPAAASPSSRPNIAPRRPRRASWSFSACSRLPPIAAMTSSVTSIASEA